MTLKNNVNFFFGLTLLFFLILTFFSKNIPFFWDETYYIGTAFNIYDSNFHSIIPELEYDRGNFPFYGFYMALWWKIFEKSLLISHIAIFPVLFGIVWEYFLISRKFLSEKWIAFALLLLILEPTFSTQSILMGHDIFLLYFFLLSVRTIFYRKKTLYAFSFLFLALHNIKGIPVALAVAVFYILDVKFFQKRKLNFSDIFIHFIPAVIWIVWMLYHQKITGWYFFTPINDYGSRLHLDYFFFKRILLSTWQVIDFGRVLLWLFIFVIAIFYRKKVFVSGSKELFLLIAISAFLFTIFFSLLDIDLCHRYFICIFLLVNILVCRFIEEFIKNFFLKYTVALLLSIGLFIGNYLLYGGGFSNGWDSSLKVLPYFYLKNQMDKFVKYQQINPEKVGTKFPLYHDKKHTYLTKEDFHYADIKNDSLQNYNYVLLSNVSNQFTVSEKEKLNSKWSIVKELSSGEVYLRLFKNPNLK
jgi:hypothetical protein